MVVDRGDRVFWLIAGAVGLFIICLSMLVGAFGPPVFQRSGDFAYSCPVFAGNRTCDPACLDCIPEFTSNTTISRFLDGLSQLNQFFALELGFQSKDFLGRSYDAYDLDVRVLRRTHSGMYERVPGNLEHSFELECDAGYPACDGLLVAVEPFLEAKSYQVWLSFPDSLLDTEWISNIHFTFITVAAEFTILAVTARVVYCLFAILVLAVFIRVMGGLNSLSSLMSSFKVSPESPVLTTLSPSDGPGSVYNWEFEQRSAAALLVAFIIYTNPLLPFELEAHNWLASSLQALTTIIFEVVVLFFMLVAFGRMSHAAILISRGSRREALLPHGWWFYGPSVGFVTGLGFIMWLAVLLINYELARDPVRAWDGDHSFAVYVFIVQVVWVAAIVYTMVAIIMAGLKIKPDMPFYPRYILISSLSASYLFCISFAALTGNLRPTTSFMFLFFFAVRALFCMGIVLGAWPVHDDNTVALSYRPSTLTYEGVPAASASLLGQQHQPGARGRTTYDGSNTSGAAIPVAYPVDVAAALDNAVERGLGSEYESDDGEEGESLVSVPLTSTGGGGGTGAASASTTTTDGYLPTDAFSARAMEERKGGGK